MSSDIVKNVNWYADYAAQALQLLEAPRKVRTDRADYTEVRAWIKAPLCCGLYAQVVGHEPTGIYHEG